MGQRYEYRGIVPTISASAALFPTAEVTGDVAIGERTIIGAGVKIIGDSHGPVRIGNDVQIIDGFPAIDIGHIPALPATPAWALRHDDLPVPTPTGPAQ
jgi:serine acetyltransferase